MESGKVSGWWYCGGLIFLHQIGTPPRECLSQWYYRQSIGKTEGSVGGSCGGWLCADDIKSAFSLGIRTDFEIDSIALAEITPEAGFFHTASVEKNVFTMFRCDETESF
jgi:hypothetical protein